MVSHHHGKLLFGLISTCFVLLLAACDFLRPPRPERPSVVPAAAVLQYEFKSGWHWELCLEALPGSASFRWHNFSKAPGALITVSNAACSSIKYPEDRKLPQIVGDDDQIEFLFPETKDTWGSRQQPCPFKVSAEDIAAFTATLTEVARSDKLTPEAAATTRGLLNLVESFPIERLWLAGGDGNTDYWRVRCKDISEAIPETNPEFPEHLKLGK
jgi:hypothetical protein